MTYLPLPKVPARRVAFIGLGTMGSGMAARLVAAGHEVRGVDIDSTRLAAFEEVGGLPAASVAEACDGAEIIMTILPRDTHVRQICLGAGGIGDSAAPGTLVIEMSTISPEASLDIHDALNAKGLRVLDAPVGRTPKDAQNGALLIMAGGRAEDFADAAPVFAPLADKIVHLGPKGSGIRMKIANNYMSMVSMVLTAETLAMARKAGIDTDAAVEVLQNTTAGRGQINVNYPNKVLRGDISPDFPLAMGAKDISLGVGLGKSLGVPLFLGANAGELFNLAASQDIRDWDCTAMLVLIERLAGLPDRALAQDTDQNKDKEGS